MKSFRKVLCLVLLVIFSTGFRTYSRETRWEVSTTVTKLFVRFCQYPTVTTNDVPAGDQLYLQTLTPSLVVASVLSDFSNVAGAYITLAETSDSEWAASVNRTIDVCFKSQTGGGGVAKQTIGSNGKATGCKIELDPNLNSSAKGFVRVFTHELGHCLGLDHSQDDDKAIMSYFAADDVLRLQMDDKMGLIQQFPVDPAYAQETPTFGASCAPKD